MNEIITYKAENKSEEINCIFLFMLSKQLQLIMRSA